MSGALDHTVRLDGTGARVAIVAARWHADIVDQMIEGALGALGEHGVARAQIDVIRCPGAFELPSVASRALQTRKHDAVICFGCVIRGDTPHFDYVAGECARGIAELGLRGETPVIFGVLTTENAEQAQQRADRKRDNKGAEAARAALEMIGIYRQLAPQGKAKAI